MRTGLALIMLSLAAVPVAASACAMTESSPPRGDCRIVGGDRLPADSGGADALCAAIRDAAAVHAPHSRFQVEVTVKGPSMLAAWITTADGTRLPEQKFAVNDRQLSRGSLERFAKALAGEVARAEAR